MPKPIGSKVRMPNWNGRPVRGGPIRGEIRAAPSVPGHNPGQTPPGKQLMEYPSDASPYGVAWAWVSDSEIEDDV